MKISYNWLKDNIDIPKKPEELADDLSLFGQEVDGIEKMGNDTVLDFEITPNRGDCLSVLGIAREVAALYDSKIKIQNYEIKEEKLNKDIKVEIEKPEICPRFTARIIDNIEIKESPKWMQEKLATYGFRPVNNIVDITNYVMVATGQPLHAFDYDKIKDGQMNIRLSKEGEEVMTLDGKNHVLKDGAIIIEDKEKIYDLAGIMGGFKSEVDEKTKTIILQGAIFDSVLIRRASKYLNLQTDASYRYERGVDFEGTIYGIDMAASLILEDCKQAKSSELIDKILQKQEAISIKLDPQKINRLLGIHIDINEMTDHLKRLKFNVDGGSVTAPSYRYYDIHIWQDVAEEIARIYGYNNIEKKSFTKEKGKENQVWHKIEVIKDICKEINFTEAYSYSFADKDKIELLGFNTDDLVETSNPITPELKFLRPDLLPSLVSQIAKNPWDPQVRIFEIEKVFNKTGEKWQFGMAVTGKQDPYIKKVMDVLKIKGEIKAISQKILDIYKIRRPVKYFVIDVDDIDYDFSEDVKYEISENKYKPISKYPPTVRDLSFVVEEKVNEKDIESNILTIDDGILLVELFDVYKKDNGKSLAFHIWLENMDGPMADTDANKIIEKIIKALEEKFNAQLRR